MNFKGIDRRILRAFYTQYVSLLLIVLVFFVTAFQKQSNTEAEKPVQNTAPLLPPLVDMTLSDPFESDGSLKKNNADLEALAKLLSNHDVRAELVFSVPVLDFEGREPSLANVARHTETITEFLMERGIPLNAYRFIIRETRGRSSRDIPVQLISEERQHVWQ